MVDSLGTLIIVAQLMNLFRHTGTMNREYHFATLLSLVLQEVQRQAKLVHPRGRVSFEH